MIPYLQKWRIYLHFSDFVSKMSISLLTATLTEHPFFDLFYLQVTYKVPFLGPVLLTEKMKKIGDLHEN